MADLLDHLPAPARDRVGVDLADDPADALHRQAQLAEALLVIAASDGGVDDARTAAAALDAHDRVTIGAVFGRLRTQQSPDAEAAKRLAAALLGDLTP